VQGLQGSCRSWQRCGMCQTAGSVWMIAPSICSQQGLTVMSSCSCDLHVKQASSLALDQGRTGATQHVLAQWHVLIQRNQTCAICVTWHHLAADLLEWVRAQRHHRWARLPGPQMPNTQMQGSCECSRAPAGGIRDKSPGQLESMGRAGRGIKLGAERRLRTSVRPARSNLGNTVEWACWAVGTWQ
jgi:hypothetical protein